MDLNKKKFLFFVLKATSELDFIVPLIWGIRDKYNDTEINVLYCIPNKRMITRKANFYDSFLKDAYVNIYDMSDFLRFKNPILRKFIHKLFMKNYWDGIQGNIFYYILKRIILRIKKIIEFFFYMFVDPDEIITKLNPDVYFWAMRNVTNKKVIKLIKNNPRSTFLYPHGAFPSLGNYEIFLDSSNMKEPLPKYCEVWYSFCREILREIYPDKKNQIYYVGYPGLDENWFNYIAKRTNTKRLEISYQKKCLLMIRKFVKNNNDPYVYDEKEFLPILRIILNSIKTRSPKLQLLIKPHPSNDYQQLKKVMDMMEFQNYKVVYNPMITLLNKVDFVITVPSTTMIIPPLYGKPLLFFHSSVKTTLESWNPKWDIFNGLQFYVEDMKEFPILLNEVITYFEKSDKTIFDKIKKDKEHYRKLYPDGSIDRCINRIKVKLSEQV